MKNIVIYQNEKGSIEIPVEYRNETLWLSLNQLSSLFGRDKSVISRHLQKIFAEDELEKNSVVAFFATTAADGKTYNVEYFNLDAIISVGYRVNSKAGTEFRKWSSKILKGYFLQGYSLNQNVLKENGIAELTQAIDLLVKTLDNSDLVSEIGKEVLAVVRNYAKTWDLLLAYDEDTIGLPSCLSKTDKAVITYENAVQAIGQFKRELNLGGLFGIEREHGLSSILGNIEQCFGGEDLYPSIEEKAAHLLYFIIKDHPFTDGNKRIGSFLFMLYLHSAAIKNLKFNENTLTAVALLTAESNPEQKELIIKLIINLLR